ncbi:MAG TPA: class I SAM-dependent methyltransferase [Acidobacteriota bacterium]|nr:class I SAM-dependent methyltransferase [Acidobacteriota bacterium]
MKIRISVAAPVLSVLIFCLTAPTYTVAQEYVPSVGQDGKDVIWVPTPEELITAMLDMAKVTSSDYVIDLGSGDGRIVIAAAKRGARALGVEYNPDMVELSKRNAQKEGMSGKASFMRGDIFETDFSQATVVTMYLLPDLNLKLRPKILEMKPGTRVVSHAFTMGDWEADQTANMDDRTAYFWIVPAKVAGTWTLQTGTGSGDLLLRQTYQKIDGSLKIDGKESPLRNAKLEGDHIEFVVGDGNPTQREYSGRVNGGIIEGTSKVPNAPEVKWTARRLAQ